jgi:hypothetical protein
MEKSFYAVYGRNGPGVYTDYEKVLVAKPYLGKGFKVKKYADREEACMDCIDGYNNLQEEIDVYYMSNNLEKNNFTVYRKKSRSR